MVLYMRRTMRSVMTKEVHRKKFQLATLCRHLHNTMTNQRFNVDRDLDRETLLKRYRGLFRTGANISCTRVVGLTPRHGTYTHANIHKRTKRNSSTEPNQTYGSMRRV